MTKAPRRSATKPVGGGAFLRHTLRGARGQFVKATPMPVATEEPADGVHDVTPALIGSTPALETSSENLILRVTRAIERELSQIEEIVGGKKTSAAQRTEAEKRARTLASLARTLAEVTKLKSNAEEARTGHDDDAVPRDLDDFRRTLERRLAQMADPEEIAADRGDDAA